jgi:hypothetical protein
MVPLFLYYKKKASMGRPRKKPLDPFEERIPGKIKVDSKTYGVHFRAPRGSKKEAKLNPRMQEANRLTLSTNAPARLINEALKPFRENFKGGLFFQFLQQHFNAQATKSEKFSVNNLLVHTDLAGDDDEDINEDPDKFWLKQYPKDINQHYPSSEMLTMTVDVVVDMPTFTIQISIKHWMNARFLSRSDSRRSLQLTFIALFPDFEDNDISAESVELPIRGLKDTDTFSFLMNIPVAATSYMLFWKAEACHNGIPEPDMNGKRMVLQRVGAL